MIRKMKNSIFRNNGFFILHYSFNNLTSSFFVHANIVWFLEENLKTYAQVELKRFKMKKRWGKFFTARAPNLV